jgi:hypothetical protein
MFYRLQKQIHLDLNHRTQVTPGLLKYMAKMNFEPYLQYVYIPNLSVIDVKNEQLEATDWWDSHSRKDYAYIFWWLEKTKTVQRIFSIVVVDDPSNPHSDEVIEHAAKPFDVEEWDWRKPDICSDTLVAAAKNVRDLTLYWSGNRAVLKSWAAEDGLALLPKLKTVRIMAPEVRIPACFLKAALSREWKPPVLIVPVEYGVHQEDRGDERKL